MFSVFFYFFHSDLVRNSAILSSDSCERHLFSAWRWSISLWLAASFSIKLYGLLINLVSDQKIYHPIDGMLLTYSKYGIKAPVGYEESVRGLEPIRKGEMF